MNWGSASEFFAMGGHALYVWGSYGACALLMAVEPILARKRRSQALIELKRELRANQDSQDETTS
ncbi:MAG: heme exporter protein CcmD [Rhodocyclaceae bacterium]|nr:heme exporter protein CcmD [Rhodocyclaceae bacterium]MCP5297768.1 heme exporter protein CcmD [Zoogloeaceae bacterium]PKO66957.1 MAG: heme exporter protein CcmD [Betaproteobacteria bacterium HGW-Betaproteobacteria-14]MBX3676158.1 heme exporter protein CcmD [Rhodocyclaceae bacterium]MBZ0133085.1 heme exporter protein CcmD [Rhodocyclaceae bacterium]